ncbi:MAG: transglutaminase family protein [Chloroflexota bacterium]|nr:transglutaminase family protein [Chloroflexota bacterium]MDE2839755.1 transglutaminase family protein [Chloroflexota bacterium]MDE2931231.1 transglutaminase family protein [Chloroflexota bacterium]
MAGSRFSRHSEHSVEPGFAESKSRTAGSNRFAIEHVSHYRYTSPARHSIMSLCLRPRNSVKQHLLHFALTTDPFTLYSSGMDPYGNIKNVFSVHQWHESLKITAHTTIDTGPAAQLPTSLAAGAWDTINAWRDSFALWDFTHDSPLARSSPALTAFIARESIKPADDPLQAVGMLSEKLHSVFAYMPGSTSAASPIDHILESGRGVCQDYAHVMIAIARSWGVPARYVSGYVHVTGESREQTQMSSQARTSSQTQTSLQTQTSSQTPQTATHAWVECRLPGLGWVGFDPTNQTLAGDHHVTIAVGRDYQDVPPSKGVLHGFVGSILEVDVRMRLLTPAQAETA